MVIAIVEAVVAPTYPPTPQQQTPSSSSVSKNGGTKRTKKISRPTVEVVANHQQIRQPNDDGRSNTSIMEKNELEYGISGSSSSSSGIGCCCTTVMEDMTTDVWKKGGLSNFCFDVGLLWNNKNKKNQPPSCTTAEDANNNNEDNGTVDTTVDDNDDDDDDANNESLEEDNLEEEEEDTGGDGFCHQQSIEWQEDVTQQQRSSTTTTRSRNSSCVVTFDVVSVRSYCQTVGDHPCVSDGVPVSLDWQYLQNDPMKLEDYEEARSIIHRHSLRSRSTDEEDELRLTEEERKELLQDGYGYTDDDLCKAKKQTEVIKRQRSRTLMLLPQRLPIESALEHVQRKSKKVLSSFTKRGKKGKRKQD